jgi:hypothetical protein
LVRRTGRDRIGDITGELKLGHVEQLRKEIIGSHGLGERVHGDPDLIGPHVEGKNALLRCALHKL